MPHCEEEIKKQEAKVAANHGVGSHIFAGKAYTVQFCLVFDEIS